MLPSGEACLSMHIRKRMFHVAESYGDFHVVEETEEEQCNHFLSFAKRSRTVQRKSLLEVPPSPASFLQPQTSVQYDQEFWDRILQWPSCPQSGEGAVVTGGLVGGATAYRPSLGLNSGWGAGFSKDSLPTPSELTRRRKARGVARRSDVMPSGVTTVLQHISELKRRQRSIDNVYLYCRQKRERCWGFMSDVPEEVVENKSDNLMQARRPPDRRNSQGWGHNLNPSPFSTNLPLYNQQTYGTGSDAMPKMFETGSDALPGLVPGQNPMMSFVMATADRQSRQSGCRPNLSHTEFWGFGSEE